MYPEEKNWRRDEFVLMLYELTDSVFFLTACPSVLMSGNTLAGKRFKYQSHRSMHCTETPGQEVNNNDSNYIMMAHIMVLAMIIDYYTKVLMVMILLQVSV